MIACNATAATIRRPCGRQSSDSLSRLAFTGCIRLNVGVVTGSNYTEFKAVASDGAVMQIYANDDGIAYRKLVNGSWKTIWSK